MEGSSGGGEGAPGGVDWEQPQTAECVLNAFSSDEDTEEELPTPSFRKRRDGNSQGRRTGTTIATPEAVSTAVGASGGGGGSDDGGAGSGGGGGGRDHNPQVSSVANMDVEDEEAEQHEGGTGKGERGGDGSEADDSGVEDDVVSLAAGDTDLDDDPAAAAAAARGDETSSAATEPENAGAGGGAGASGEASNSQGETGEACPVCARRYPAEELEMHVNACLTRQEREEEERSKKEERAKRWVGG